MTKLKRHQELGLKPIKLSCPEELHLPRKTLHALLAARSAHGDFESYHGWMGHTDHQKCTCGRIKTPDHPVRCKKTQKSRPNWPKLEPKPSDLKNYWLRLLTSPADFALSLQVTRYFQDICAQRGGRT